jgi:hypothetical protein
MIVTVMDFPPTQMVTPDPDVIGKRPPKGSETGRDCRLWNETGLLDFRVQWFIGRKMEVANGAHS